MMSFMSTSEILMYSPVLPLRTNCTFITRMIFFSSSGIYAFDDIVYQNLLQPLSDCVYIYQVISTILLPESVLNYATYISYTLSTYSNIILEFWGTGPRCQL